MEKKALEDMQERGQQMSMRGRQRETASEAADAAEERAWEEQQANDWEDWLEDDCDVPCIFTPGLTFPRAEAALEGSVAALEAGDKERKETAAADAEAVTAERLRQVNNPNRNPNPNPIPTPAPIITP